MRECGCGCTFNGIGWRLGIESLEFSILELLGVWNLLEAFLTA